MKKITSSYKVLYIYTFIHIGIFVFYIFIYLYAVYIYRERNLYKSNLCHDAFTGENEDRPQNSTAGFTTEIETAVLKDVHTTPTHPLSSASPCSLLPVTTRSRFIRDGLGNGIWVRLKCSLSGPRHKMHWTSFPHLQAKVWEYIFHNS